MFNKDQDSRPLISSKKNPRIPNYHSFIQNSESMDNTKRFAVFFTDFQHPLLPYLSYKDHLVKIRQLCKALDRLVEETEAGKIIRHFLKQNETFLTRIYENYSCSPGIGASVLVSTLPMAGAALLMMWLRQKLPIVFLLGVAATPFLLLACLARPAEELFAFPLVSQYQALSGSVFGLTVAQYYFLVDILPTIDVLAGTDSYLLFLLAYGIYGLVSLMTTIRFGIATAHGINDAGQCAKTEQNKALRSYIEANPFLMFSENERRAYGINSPENKDTVIEMLTRRLIQDY